MNKIMLIGRLAKDVELTATTNGTSVAKFQLALSDYTTKGEVSYFFPCVAYGKQAENAKKYLKKGNQIGISGKMTQRVFTGKDDKQHSTFEIMVETIDFLYTPKTEEVEEEKTEVNENDLPF